MAIRRAALALAVAAAAAGSLAVTGCQDAAPSRPSPVPLSPGSASAAAATPAATSSPAAAVPRQLSSRAVARLDVRDGAVTGESGEASTGTSYDVIAVCSGAESFSYRLQSAGDDVGGGSVRCGTPQRNSALTDATGTVEIRMADTQDVSAGLTAHLELIPADAPWDPPSS